MRSVPCGPTLYQIAPLHREVVAHSDTHSSIVCASGFVMSLPWCATSHSILNWAPVPGSVYVLPFSPRQYPFDCAGVELEVGFELVLVPGVVVELGVAAKFVIVIELDIVVGEAVDYIRLGVGNSLI